MLNSTLFYDLIGFGDEVPGVLAVISAARFYHWQSGRYPKTLLMCKSDAAEGIGGHLVRGMLAYLDRSSVPLEIRQSIKLGSFGDPPAIYQEFLQRAEVDEIALDSGKANVALRQMLDEINAQILSNAEIESVLKDSQRLAGIKLAGGETYTAQQFIDSTVNAELAQAAGVTKLSGFETLGLPESELAVTLCFETQGLSVSRLRQIETIYLNRFNDLTDEPAQTWLNIAAGQDSALVQQLRNNLVDSQGKLKTFYAGSDYIDVRSPALSIAYHSFRGTKLSFGVDSPILDNGNIAVLNIDRLSWNALLFHVTADRAEALVKGGAKPTSDMLQEMSFVSRWFESLGATKVVPASELYIRHVGNVTGVIAPLSGSDMLSGGVPEREALGTFGYAFDARGGIDGLGQRAAHRGINSLSFGRPLFNIGIQHALIKDIPNLAVVSPASGFTGYGCLAGRIVEFNVAVGQGVGIACSLALLGRNLADISNAEVRSLLTEVGQSSRIYGTVAQDALKLADFEQRNAPEAIA